MCKLEWEGGAAIPGLVKPEIDAAGAQQLCKSKLVLAGLEMLHKVLFRQRVVGFSIEWGAEV